MILSCLVLIGLGAGTHAGPSFFGSNRGGSTTSPPQKRLTISNVSPNLRNMQYAVRGSVVIAADQIASDLETNPEKYPFKEIIFTNIGNPHQVGQKCLTWPRQVLALCDLPAEVGVDHPSIGQLFPKDAIARAREIKDALGVAGTGAYSHSKGHIHFRKDVARFIEERDGGVVCDPECLFLTNGASSGINMVLTALIADENSGVMIPIPQYPIYSATIDILNGKKVGYFLDEKKGWDLNIEELERSLAEAKEKGINVNSFVLINPGNPTGQVLSEKAVQDIVTFCSKHNLVLLADEVYQENVYKGEFVSCKKAAHDLGLIDENKIELVSFHSCSKGLFGECGRRGGYMELVGFEPEVIEEIYKLASSGLCAGLAGQIMLSLMVRGPQPGDESYESHQKERNDIYDSLKRRSKTVSDGLDAISGFSCEPTQGAMYCFPSVQMPPKAIQEAEEKGISPDTLYALSLLEYSGICVVPASGFGQEEGRYGFRTTFLPSEDKIANAVELFRKHHESFCEKYN